MTYANLRGDVDRSDLRDPDISISGYLGGDVNLRNANLFSADLTGANLSEAVLRKADLTLASLDDADLADAMGVTNEELQQQALTLAGATMPNGQKYEDWLKSKKAQGKDE